MPQRDHSGRPHHLALIGVDADHRQAMRAINLIQRRWITNHKMEETMRDVSRYPESYPTSETNNRVAKEKLDKPLILFEDFWLPEQGSNLRQFD